MKKELMQLLGYNLYTFRKDYQLTEAEMLELLRALVKHPSFEKEYGEEF